MDPVRKRQLEVKVYAGERLNREDGEVLAECDDLAWLGRLAHDRRIARHGDRVTFMAGGTAPDPVSDQAAASPAEQLKAFALACLMSDNETGDMSDNETGDMSDTETGDTHVTCSTAVHGVALAQLALNFGADDLVAPADADRDELLHLIWDAGLRPVERDAEYGVIREYDPPVPLAERRAHPQRVWA